MGSECTIGTTEKSMKGIGPMVKRVALGFGRAPRESSTRENGKLEKPMG